MGSVRYCDNLKIHSNCNSIFHGNEIWDSAGIIALQPEADLAAQLIWRGALLQKALQQSEAFQPALRRIQAMLQIVAQHGQVLHRAEGGWVLKLQR